MNERSRFDVFVSHNGEERAVALELSDRLQSRGLRVWLDVWELRPGLSWQQGMLEGLAASDSCAVLIGNSGFGGWHRREIEAALQRQGNDYPVIPVLLPNAPDRQEIDAFLTSLTWVDFRQGLDDLHALDRIIWGITGVRPSRPAQTEVLKGDHRRPTSRPRVFHIDTPRDGDLIPEPFTLAGTGPPNEEVLFFHRAPGTGYQRQSRLLDPHTHHWAVTDKSGRWVAEKDPSWNSAGPYEIFVAGPQGHLPSQPVTVYFRDTSNVRRMAERVRRAFNSVELSYEVRTAFLEATKLQSGQLVTSGTVTGPIHAIEDLAFRAAEAVTAALRNLVVDGKLRVTVWIDPSGRIRLEPDTAWASYYAFAVPAAWGDRVFGYPPGSDINSLHAMRSTQMAWRLLSNIGQMPRKPFGDKYEATNTYLEIRHSGYRPEFVSLDSGQPQSITADLVPVLEKRIAILNFPPLDPNAQIDGYSQLIAKEIVSAIQHTSELATFGYFSSLPPNAKHSADHLERLGRPQIRVVNEVLTLTDVQAVEARLEAIDNSMVSGEGRFLQRKTLDIQLIVRGSYRLLH